MLSDASQLLLLPPVLLLRRIADFVKVARVGTVIEWKAVLLLPLVDAPHAANTTLSIRIISKFGTNPVEMLLLAEIAHSKWIANNLRIRSCIGRVFFALLFFHSLAWTLSTLELLSIVSEYSRVGVWTGRSVSTLSSLLRQ